VISKQIGRCFNPNLYRCSDQSGEFMAQKRVLVVDDTTSIRQAITALLKVSGYEAAEASTGDLALQLMQNSKFDLLLTDWNMPGMSGAELVKAIRATDRVIPIVMVTAEADRQKIMELQAIGVNGYLLKPFKQQALLTVLAKIFAEKT
jgi:two-component system, chemotaxis family, chemotaxis protein CheY